MQTELYALAAKPLCFYNSNALLALSSVTAALNLSSAPKSALHRSKPQQPFSSAADAGYGIEVQPWQSYEYFNRSGHNRDVLNNRDALGYKPRIVTNKYSSMD